MCCKLGYKSAHNGQQAPSKNDPPAGGKRANRHWVDTMAPQPKCFKSSKLKPIYMDLASDRGRERNCAPAQVRQCYVSLPWASGGRRRTSGLSCSGAQRVGRVAGAARMLEADSVSVQAVCAQAEGVRRTVRNKQGALPAMAEAARYRIQPCMRSHARRSVTSGVTRTFFAATVPLWHYSHAYMRTAQTSSFLETT